MGGAMMEDGNGKAKIGRHNESDLQKPLVDAQPDLLEAVLLHLIRTSVKRESSHVASLQPGM